LTDDDSDNPDQDDAQTPAESSIARQTERLTSKDRIQRHESDGRCRVAEGGDKSWPEADVREEEKESQQGTSQNE
jgi:hypothetical protein